MGIGQHEAGAAGFLVLVVGCRCRCFCCLLALLVCGFTDGSIVLYSDQLFGIDDLPSASQQRDSTA